MNTHSKYRVIEKHYDSYKIQTESGIKSAILKGSFLHTIKSKESLPCVGDWVNVANEHSHYLINGIEKRYSLVSRKFTGNTTEQQAIAANVDYVFIVLGLDRERHYSDRLLERLLTIAWNSGATPIVILNKCDLNDMASLIKRQLETVALDINIIICSAEDKTGIEEVVSYLVNGAVGMFIGPSGVGKSTLTNTILKNSIQKTNSGRDKDKRGRHTTSACYLFELENGGYIVDSSGIKEVQAWAESEDIEAVFGEIQSASNLCHFRDCSHEGEPGCAVQQELEYGNITAERYDSYLHLKQEQAFLERRRNVRNKSAERQHGKDFTKMVKSTLSKKQILRNAQR
ncbi:ribosome small subunit-dependent GTPase A [Pseudoalteromonas piscicida]|uniref:Small ribosomal subunit biogenesis GTPase RsgA n=1 Tax=Pseudoalteromonas piscicida TaxID=43662 RepID=A0ABM6NCJ5_PSEO7|nr:ribosome small subunit-dependent GTPase A [Pseudoalteromonas piscicida]ATD06552.1 ribosome biogenesis GTPase [Pseudoalteromonas piscicida]WPU33262.1 ribosome small subunit-dependent GTPase A [Pseudoalteromonas piscicida]